MEPISTGPLSETTTRTFVLHACIPVSLIQVVLCANWMTAHSTSNSQAHTGPFLFFVFFITTVIVTSLSRTFTAVGFSLLEVHGTGFRDKNCKRTASKSYTAPFPRCAHALCCSSVKNRHQKK